MKAESAPQTKLIFSIKEFEKHVRLKCYFYNVGGFYLIEQFFLIRTNDFVQNITLSFKTPLANIFL
jgi:hypothetical protein